ncbi:UNVERIFIED_ORG: TRAP-type C4-dicarboxylate transport system substrate-binding protein [Martelella mediterranea]
MAILYRLALAVATLSAGTAAAQTTLDFSTPWGENNFQAKAAREFARSVGEATDGNVQINVLNAGEIGVSGSQSMAAVETGIVQMADFLLFQQAGEERLLAIDTLPYLIQGQEEMAAFLEVASPVFDEIAARHNQKILYYVPWPSPGLFSEFEISTPEDLQGRRIRAFNPGSFEFLRRLGAAPLEMPWGDVVPALAAGTIDGVATSTSSGVIGKLWDMTPYFSPLQWSTSTDVVTVNLDAWNALSEDDRAAIEGVAETLVAKFWAQSAAEDAANTEILIENGITVLTPQDSLKAAMYEAGRGMWDTYIGRIPAAEPIIREYAAAVGK